MYAKVTCRNGHEYFSEGQAIPTCFKGVSVASIDTPTCPTCKERYLKFELDGRVYTEAGEEKK